MGKLIKYELRKQRASRMVIFIALAIALVGFWTGILFMNNTLMGVSAAAMVFGAVFVLFYTGIEVILVFNRDLRTKQSYMLWMVPHSTYEILGAKLIAGILQMVFVFLAFFAAGVVTVTVTAASEGSLGDLLRSLGRLFKEVTNSNVDWGAFFGVCLLLLISWINVMMVGFLAIILTRTVLLNARFGGVIAVIVFFLINIGIERIYVLFDSLIDMAPLGGMGGVSLFDYIFYIVMTVLAFFLTGWIADEKLSV